jgi:hypothetical protein
MTRAIALFLAGALAAAPCVAFAAETPKPAAPAATTSSEASAEGGVCLDEAALAAERSKRDAALAELGRRLAAEPVAPGEFRVLNRSGHNYGPRPQPHRPQPPAKPAPDTAAR